MATASTNKTDATASIAVAATVNTAGEASAQSESALNAAILITIRG